RALQQGAVAAPDRRRALDPAGRESGQGPDLPDAPALRRGEPGRRARRLPDEPELPDGDVPLADGDTGRALREETRAQAARRSLGPLYGGGRDVPAERSRGSGRRRGRMAELPRAREPGRPPGPPRGERL